LTIKNNLNDIGRENFDKRHLRNSLDLVNK